MDMNPIGIAVISSLATLALGGGIGMFLYGNRNKQSETLTVTSDETDGKVYETVTPQPKKFNFPKESRKLINEIYKAADKYHAAKDIYLSSDWKSELDNGISMDIKLYSIDSQEATLYMYHKPKKGDSTLKALIRNKEGHNSKHQIDEAVLEAPQVHDDIMEHLYSILGQIKAKTEVSNNKLVEILTMKRNIRIWYKDAEEAVASYPKYAEKFKRFRGEGKYADFEGRFIFKTDDAEILDVVDKFPDADMVEIYDTKNEKYESYDISAIQEMFVF